MSKTISYAITVHDELESLTKLLNFLQISIRKDDEIVIQYDKTSVSNEVLEYLELMDKMHTNHIIFGFPLNNDFAAFKNNLLSKCTKDYMFQIDADEMISEFLVQNLPELLEKNSVDLIFVPRINIVDGITRSLLDKWGYNVSKLDSQIGEKVIDKLSGEYKLLKELGYIIEEKDGLVKYYKPIINFCDFQTRIIKLTPDVKWMGVVHERITGYNNFSNFPAKEEWCIMHVKTADRQELQNNFYETLG